MPHSLKTAFITQNQFSSSYTNVIQTTKRATPLLSTISTTSSTEYPTADSKYDETNKANGIIGSYEPHLFEGDIYKWWEESGCFDPDARPHTRKDSYTIPMPPPNVTGRLHMGHAIFVALQDILARFHRMRGRPVLWLPGKFHLCDSVLF